MNLVVLGSGGVGKSACTIQFVQHKFITNYDPTIQDTYNTIETVDGWPVVLTLCDTAGQVEFAQFRIPYIKNCDGVLLIFSVADPQTFREVGAFHREITRAKSRDVACPVVVFGNKTDLVRSRAVSREEGIALASSLRISGTSATYTEGSATNYEDVQAAWYTLVREVRRSHGEATPPSSPLAANHRGCLHLPQPASASSLGSTPTDEQSKPAPPARGEAEAGTPEGASNANGKKTSKSKSKARDGGGSSCNML